MNSYWLNVLVDLPTTADVAIRLCAISIVGWTVHLLLWRSNPRWRMLLWRSVAVALITVPVLTSILPKFRVPIVAPVVAQRAVPIREVGTGVVVDPSEYIAQIPDVAEMRSADREIGIPIFIEENTVEPSPVAGALRWIRHNRLRVGAMTYVFTAVLLLVCMLIGHYRSRVVLKAAGRAPKRIEALATEIARRMHLRKTPRLMVSPYVLSPIAFGAFRPVIVLPERMIRREYDEDLTAVLAHESAHVKSKDVLWGILVQIVSIVYWFFPLVWGIRRVHISACEKVCDAVAADLVGGAEEYSGTLARVALALIKKRRTLSGIPMAWKAAVVDRLNLLKRKIYALPPRRRWICAFILSVGIIVSAITTFRLAYADVEKETSAKTSESAFEPVLAEDSREIVFHVVDKETGKPIEGVNLDLKWKMGRAPEYRMGEFTGSAKTLDVGRASFSLPVKDIGWLRVKTSYVGYVPRFVLWMFNGSNEFIPKERKIEMEKGILIGGKVVDENGLPIKGVEVTLQVDTPEVLKNEGSALNGISLQTDESGVWGFDGAHPDFVRVYVDLRCSGYLPRHCSSHDDSIKFNEELRRQSLVLEMKKGIIFKGAVLDNKGNPIAGARIARFRGDDYFDRIDPQSTTRITDVSGEFQFEDAVPGKTTILVKAKGYAPAMKDVYVVPDATETVVLSYGADIKFRVLDESLKPMEGALIGLSEWNGQNLWLVQDLSDTVPTDKEGYAELKSVPESEAEFSVHVPGYRLHEITASPGAEEHRVVMRAYCNARGSVIDGETKKPVERFKILTGYSPKKSNYLPEEFYYAGEGGNGEYETAFYIVSGTEEHYYVRVEAEGYVPDLSAEIDGNESTAIRNFELKRIPARVGAPDGAFGRDGETMNPDPTEESGAQSAKTQPKVDKMSDYGTMPKMPAGTTENTSQVVSADERRTTAPADNDPESAKAEDTREIVFHAVDKETGRPLEGVELDVKWNVETARMGWTGEFRSLGVSMMDGRYVLPLPKETITYFKVGASAKGYIPNTDLRRFVEFDNGLPMERTIEMEKAAVIGGNVLDSRGEPLPGVKIGLSMYLHLMGNSQSDDRHLSGISCLTEADGTWRYDGSFPVFTQITLDLQAPGHVRKKVSISIHEGEATRRLFEQSLETIMEKGCSVTGIVTDGEENPIEGACVATGGWGLEGTPTDKIGIDPTTTTTNERGEFEFSDVEPKECLLLTTAPGYQAKYKKVTVTMDGARTTIQLRPGNTVAFRVINALNEPVEGAEIIPPREFYYYTVFPLQDTHLLTDWEGFVEWDSAPEEKLEYEVTAKGYQRATLNAAADEREHLIRLEKAPSITGTVVDALTKEPIKSFHVYKQEVIAGSGGSRSEFSSYDAEGGNGRYRIYSGYQYDKSVTLCVRVQAEGYIPADSEVIEDYQTSCIRNIEMTRAPVRLVTPNGEPVEGAELVWLPIDHGFAMFDAPARFFAGRNAYFIFRSRSDGTFPFAVPLENSVLFVKHDCGFALLDFNDFSGRPEIVLQPWGRVDGTFAAYANSIPQVTAEVSIDTPYGRRDLHAPLDSSGQFVVDHVFPGNGSVGLGLQSRPISVRSGETTYVNPDKSGVTVSGNVTTLDDLKNLVDWKGRNHVMLVKRKDRASTAFTEGINEDGKFTLRGIPPGDYTLLAFVRGKDGKNVGMARKEFSVTEDDLAAGTIDVGAMDLQPAKATQAR